MTVKQLIDKLTAPHMVQYHDRPIAVACATFQGPDWISDISEPGFDDHDGVVYIPLVEVIDAPSDDDTYSDRG